MRSVRYSSPLPPDPVGAGGSPLPPGPIGVAGPSPLPPDLSVEAVAWPRETNGTPPAPSGSGPAAQAAS
jgi:hypothetical protein